METIENLINNFITHDRFLDSYLTDLEVLFSTRETEVHAFLPEPGRFSRLRGEVNQLKMNNLDKVNRPPLFCLPVGVKDIFHVEGFPTRAGSELPADVIAGPEAFIIKKIKELGALIVGKTITTEFAYFAPGPTRNPHHLKHTPGGSSSGSAAAVSTGLVPFSFGSQTIGSIIRPASYCGVVGYKPTFGRISTNGVIPLAPSADTVGFFARTTKDMEFTVQYLVEGWNARGEINHKPVLGIPVGPYLEQAFPEMKTFFAAVSHQLKSHGYSVLEIPAMENFDDIFRHHTNLVAYEAARTHSVLIEKYRNLYHPETIELIDKGRKVTQNDYEKALSSRFAFRDFLRTLQKQHGNDLWISPPAQGAAPRGLKTTGNPVMNLPWTHCGLPTINLPIGYNQEKLPLGLQITASWNQDEALLAWGKGIEEVIQHNKNFSH